jgi:hypothetical protein
MPTVDFGSSPRFRFACSLIESATTQLNFKIDSKKETIEFEDSRIARLFERLDEIEPAILIYPGVQKDYWIVTGNNEAILDRTINRLVRFLIPSYGYFASDSPIRYNYKPESSKVQEFGASLYTAGYYRWESPTNYRDKVLNRLILWLDLEAQQPDVHAVQIKSYYHLNSVFQDALVQKNWELASHCLAEIQNNHLSTAENLVFLRLQLWASQGYWNRIWEHSDFPIWAQLSMPRSVRTLLLTAFHSQVLEPLESQRKLVETLSAFKENRPRLGMLLTGPFELEKAPVARVVAYQSTVDEDHQRISFLKNTETDMKTKQLLQDLSAVIYSPKQPQTTFDDPVTEIKNLLIDKDFARAEDLINHIKNKKIKTLLMIELAFHSKDRLNRSRAWESYQNLSFEEQEDLSLNEHFVERYLLYLKDHELPAEDQAYPVSDNIVVWAKNIVEARTLAWKDICNLESQIRKLVAIRLERQYGDNWSSKLNPEKVARWKEMRKKDSIAFNEYKKDEPEHFLLDYSYLGDLLEIINKYWNLFGDVFGADKQSKREFHKKLQAIIRIRNPLAHNREVPGNELKRANVYCTDLMMVLNRFV